MKKIILLAAGALALASVAAYAQMHQGQQPGQAPAPSGHGMMQGPMHGQGRMHGNMQTQMHGMQGHQGASGHAGHGSLPTGSADRGGHDAHANGGPRGDTGPSSQALHAINLKMHEGMNITFSGNADVDFVRGMIPHHQGAVDMAKVLIAFGKDPELRRLAEAIVKAQESEIALMQAWLQRNAP